jgi:hypothetical protein
MIDAEFPTQGGGSNDRAVVRGRCPPPYWDELGKTLLGVAVAVVGIVLLIAILSNIVAILHVAKIPIIGFLSFIIGYFVLTGVATMIQYGPTNMSWERFEAMSSTTGEWIMIAFGGGLAIAVMIGILWFLFSS